MPCLLFFQDHQDHQDQKKKEVSLLGSTNNPTHPATQKSMVQNDFEKAPSLKSWSGWKAFFKELLKGFSAHDHMNLAASLAFYTALSLAPLLLMVLSVVGLMGEDSQQQVLQTIQETLGSQAAGAITTIMDSAQSQPKTGSTAGIIGLLTLLFSASGVFAQLQDSLNKIFEAQGKISSGAWGWIRKRLLSMGMVLSLGFIAMVSLIVSAGLAFVFTHDDGILRVLSFFVSLAVFAALFGLIFKILPDTHLTWKQGIIGGAFTAILFTVGKTLIGLYLGHSAVGSAYGAAGSLIVLLVWVYYSSIIVFIGAEMTRIVAHKKVSVEALKINSPKQAQAQLRPQSSVT